MSDRPILILGGTAEAVTLAAVLSNRGYRVISSLAGRTRSPVMPEGETRIGGFGGVEGLIDFVRNREIACLIDATHPFATRISDNAAAAVKATGTPSVRLERPPWVRKAGDNWNVVATIDEAVGAIPSKARVLLALGRQHIAPFSRRGDVHFLVRMIEPPELGFDLIDFELELSRPGTFDEECTFLRAKRLTHIVCRNSGGMQSYGKIRAARDLGLPVIMIDRPHRAPGLAVSDIESVVEYVRQVAIHSERERKEWL